MIKTIINKKQNSITFLWEDGSISWYPLNEYTFKKEDYFVIEQNEAAGYSEQPRIVKGTELFKKYNRS